MGKGHRDHVCRDCSRLPAEERQGVEQEEEIFGFLKQSHISAKNMSRLKMLMSSSNPSVAELAGIVFEVARVQTAQETAITGTGPGEARSARADGTDRADSCAPLLTPHP